MSSLEDYKRAYQIQKQAREIAENLLEEKSRELYEKNCSLKNALKAVQNQQQKLIAQEKQASIGQLSAGLAHEINNPNAFVQSNLDSLNNYIEHLTNAYRELETLIDSRNATHAAAINKKYDIDYILDDADKLLSETKFGTQRIETIIKGLRYFTNPDSKHTRSFDLNACIAQTINLIRTEAECQITFLEHYNNIPELKGIPSLISQAVGNILKNAAQSTPKSEQVTVTTQLRQNSIVIMVDDDGDGIAATELTSVFDPFYTTKPEANGMGLAISHTIIGQHNGSIDLESEPGKGTKVRILIPVQQN